MGNFKITSTASFMLIAAFWFLWIMAADHRRVEDEAFEGKINEFIQAGRRNTLEQGYELCLRINNLESKIEVDPTDCKLIYKIKND